MEDLRKTYTFEQRTEFQETISRLRPYLLAVLKERSGDRCENCGEHQEKYDIDHKIYNPEITIEHIQLLCIPCHKEKTDFTPFRNRKE